MTYEQALKAALGNLRNCGDAELMASFLAGNAQILLGAVSPKLIWQGAQAKGMTTQELVTLIHDAPMAAADLMWAA
jgi:hypothetical protein